MPTIRAMPAIAVIHHVSITITDIERSHVSLLVPDNIQLDPDKIQLEFFSAA